MDASHAMEPKHLRANRQLRYATPAIRPGVDSEEQDMEFCYPCPPTFLLPISPAAHVVKEAATHPAIRGLERRDIQHPRQRFLDAPAHFARQGPKVSEPQDQEQVEPPQCEWTYDHHDPDKYPKWIYFSGQWEVQPVKKRQ